MFSLLCGCTEQLGHFEQHLPLLITSLAGSWVHTWLCIDFFTCFRADIAEKLQL